MRRTLVSLVFIICLGACHKSNPVGQEAPHGVPPPDTWRAPANPPPGAGIRNPHAGMDMTNPHAGVDMTNNPHGGSDPGASLDGTIDVAPALKDQVGKAKTIFLFAKSADASGTVTNPMPIGVITFPPSSTFPLAFHMTDADSMTGAAGGFEGPVVLTARADGDGNATSKEPGDVEGKTTATIPAKGLKIVLDTPLQ